MAGSVHCPIIPASQGKLIHDLTGNDLYSAITAVVAANLVLVAYIFQSIMDEKNAAKPADSKEESKKDR
jgi:hypothetical protein